MTLRSSGQRASGLGGKSTQNTSWLFSMPIESSHLKVSTINKAGLWGECSETFITVFNAFSASLRRWLSL